ncbi:hypothetical protein EDC90_100885 [Martelella mediterranea]|uniref:Uncharacterized protein n=1 Tax=Martelella mediterranea TaxID=293089 RepID=A0A4R3NVP4_9HYPH|nr:hypothetical protein EDC90_100885 [Martelella mediterranea]
MHKMHVLYDEMTLHFFAFCVYKKINEAARPLKPGLPGTKFEDAYSSSQRTSIG